MNKTLKVKRIESRDSRRMLYGKDDNYYVIASSFDKVEKGDIIEYQPYGIHFGWFIRKVTPKENKMKNTRKKKSGVIEKGKERLVPDNESEWFEEVRGVTEEAFDTLKTPESKPDTKPDDVKEEKPGIVFPDIPRVERDDLDNEYLKGDDWDEDECSTEKPKSGSLDPDDLDNEYLKDLEHSKPYPKEFLEGNWNVSKPHNDETEDNTLYFSLDDITDEELERVKSQVIQKGTVEVESVLAFEPPEKTTNEENEEKLDHMGSTPSFVTSSTKMANTVTTPDERYEPISPNHILFDKLLYIKNENSFKEIRVAKVIDVNSSIGAFVADDENTYGLSNCYVKVTK